MAANQLDVYLEIGRRRVFAAAVAWPGWCRSGRDENGALATLLAYGPRYHRVLQDTGLDFKAPAETAACQVVARLAGSAATDFGAPAATPPDDADPVSEAGHRQWRAILQACWRTFDASAAAAQGLTLQTGPRGGGRDLARITTHVLEADAAYLARLGRKLPREGPADEAAAFRQTRQALLDGLGAAVRGEVPAQGPRGGQRWTARTFVRRVAWHVLDHAWEIEDRLPPAGS